MPLKSQKEEKIVTCMESGTRFLVLCALLSNHFDCSNSCLPTVAGEHSVN
jgi:hypothetical protein